MILNLILNNLQQHFFEFSVNVDQFSQSKTLYPFQIQALENALKTLWLYYQVLNQDKYKLFEEYKKHGLDKEFFKIDAKVIDIYRHNQYEYEERGENNYLLPIWQVLNRAGFWMATGSGKTLVAIKLIEILFELMRLGEIPQGDILFLTYKDDLLEQFHRELEDFNSSRDRKLRAESLKDYSKIKGSLYGRLENTFFYYRADNLSDEKGQERLDYRKFPKNFYIILDEAHKGGQGESKRKAIFSVLSRDGFLFNFSATFTDEIDFITCAYRYNLADYVRDGYGKKITVVSSNLEALNKKEDFSSEEKRKVILKSLLLLTLLSKVKREKTVGYYPEPLMLVLGNSVNVEDSDLELFFKELSNIAKGKDIEKLFKSAKEELLLELTQAKYEFVEKNGIIDRVENLIDLIQELNFEDIYREVFNVESTVKNKNFFGNIEVIKIPENREELLFKHTLADRPFALIKIGDISAWLKEKLEGYQIVETYQRGESVFRKLEKDYESVKILLGSRAFYEGWDNPRPCVILYINIGKGQDARKFVLQSLGRGIRLVPKEDMRGSLRRNDLKAYESLKNYAELLESLFVYGTRPENLRETIRTLREEEETVCIGEFFKVNEEVANKPLLIPVYRELKGLVSIENGIKFVCSQEELKLLRSLVGQTSDIVLYLLFGLSPSLIKVLREYLSKDENFDTKGRSGVRDLQVLMKRLKDHLTVTRREVESFESAHERIVHFKYVRINKRLFSEELNKKFEKSRKKIGSSIDLPGRVARLLSLLEHYYLPLVILENSKNSNVITHVVKTESERVFIDDLVDNIIDEDYGKEFFDWWYFSRIDATLDEVFIPWYDPNKSKMEKFKPDFVFWFKKKDNGSLYIVFVDPKSTEFTEAERKIDGYKSLFTENGSVRVFEHDFTGMKVQIKVLLFMYNQKGLSSQSYGDYWIKSAKELIDRVVNN